MRLLPCRLRFSTTRFFFALFASYTRCLRKKIRHQPGEWPLRGWRPAHGSSSLHTVDRKPSGYWPLPGSRQTKPRDDRTVPELSLFSSEGRCCILTMAKDLGIVSTPILSHCGLRLRIISGRCLRSRDATKVLRGRPPSQSIMTLYQGLPTVDQHTTDKFYKQSLAPVIYLIVLQVSTNLCNVDHEV